MRPVGAAALAFAALLAAAVPVAAQEPEGGAIPTFRVLRIEPAPGSVVELAGRLYGGVLEIRAHDDGLAVVEHTGIDGYLAGIKEVPYGWPEDALAAQAVAARSYLAATLAGGRSSNGRKYGYDICATSACQVYAGAGTADLEGGERWVAAVTRTADEILVYDEGPAQTFYHSTSGGRTEAIQDIWQGSEPRTYLRGAQSPGEPSPFETWRIALPAAAFVDILAADGLDVAGPLESVRVVSRPPGQGVWPVEIRAGGRTSVVQIGDIRAAFNRKGRDLYPELLPGLRPDGRRYPQPILSYRFQIDVVDVRRVLDRLLAPWIPAGQIDYASTVVISGRGWGHHIGMSQYGALAMAEQGAGYAAILGHYYGGLQPEARPDMLPEDVAVGLMWGEEEVVVHGHGRFAVIADGERFAVGGDASWRLLPAGGGRVAVVPPPGLLFDLLRDFRPRTYPVRLS